MWRHSGAAALDGLAWARTSLPCLSILVASVVRYTICRQSVSISSGGMTTSRALKHVTLCSWSARADAGGREAGRSPPPPRLVSGGELLHEGAEGHRVVTASAESVAGGRSHLYRKGMRVIRCWRWLETTTGRQKGGIA